MSLRVIDGGGPANEEVVECLEALLDAAMRGDPRLVGFAVIALYDNQEYRVETSGEAKEVPVFVRGLVPELVDHLTQLIRSRRP